jgi:hypothetical protein
MSIAITVFAPDLKGVFVSRPLPNPTAIAGKVTIVPAWSADHGTRIDE